jgi:hypothetical protein
MRRKRKTTTTGAKVGAAASAAGLAGAAGAAAWRLVKRRRTTERPQAALSVWTCECGQELRVVGEDRHRVYWLPDAPDSEPLLDRACPSCGRDLPDRHVAPV